MPVRDSFRGCTLDREAPVLLQIWACGYHHPEMTTLDGIARSHDMNNDDEMSYLWIIRPDISKEGIHVLVEFKPIQSQTFLDVQNTHVSAHEDHSNVRQHVTVITKMVRNEPSINAPYDYTSSGAFLDMGLGENIDDLIESRTIKLLDWIDAMTDLQ
ncbi:hypothetical protein M9H77_16763 [Catharanthus roseus]|uniref:Uncharacterized protein n=1 Tax=Catharanthus roseus TaxID=4058 RepID=A0ACC0B2N6_CATRO|nr:hypothetical protein M9H77_16763 [Catharanthus roseus]